MAEKFDGWKVATLILLTPFTAFLRGYALVMLWRWFLVPTFGVHELRVVNAIGLMWLVQYVTHDSSIKRDSSQDTITIIGIAILGPLMAVGFGWVIHLFM
jgi:hypothetical protein